MISRTPWTAEEIEQVRQFIASGKTTIDASEVLGRSRKAIMDVAIRNDLGCWQAHGGKPRVERQLPDDFAQLATNMTNDELAAHYRTRKENITLWRKLTGVFAVRVPPPPRQHPTLPAGFALDAPGLTMKQAKERYNRGETTLNRWAIEADICFRTPRLAKTIMGPKGAVDRTQRDMTRAGQAADYLRRLSSVFRCDANGRAKTNGKFWRRGSATLTDADLIERAEDRGWNPHAWKALSAPIPTTTTEGARA